MASALAALGAATVTAIVAAVIAIRRERAARAAARVSDARHAERDARLAQLEASNKLAADLAHALTDRLTAIVGQAELLMAGLDPSGATALGAREIRDTAMNAARLTRPLREAALPSRIREAVVASTAVLVVEDEPGIRELIKVVLERAGYAVLAADGPHAALAALRRQPAISLMLVDLIMPQMDGYDFVAEARRSVAGVPVIFMSSFAPDAARQTSRDRFLAKPFHVDALIAMVRAALSVPR